MVYLFYDFCKVVSVSCFLFVWSLAEGLYTVVSVWWLRVLIFFPVFTALDIDAREHNTERRGVSGLQWYPQCVDGAMHRAQRLPTLGVYTGEYHNRLSRSSNARDLLERTRKMHNIGTALKDKVFLRCFEFCAVFLHSELKDVFHLSL